MLGIANENDYNQDIWDALVEGAKPRDDDMTEEDYDIVHIDYLPIQEKYKTENNRNPITGTVTNSFPHPGLTHLILTDNPVLLERKLAALCPSGLMYVLLITFTCFI